MADDRGIEEILCSIQHHDQGIRRSGEILYHQFQSSINYVDIVIKFSSDAAKPAHFRHLAIVLLNQQIAKDWNSFPQPSKGALVQFCFDRCSDQIKVIRTACMLMLSKIASQSSESETKDILTYLSSQLMSPDSFVTAATLKCLCTIAEEVERHESLIDAIRLCYGKVHEIITSSEVTYIMSQKYSSKLMRICIGQFGAARMACSLEESATVIIGQFLPVWYSLVVQTLSRIQSVTDMNNQLAVIIEMLRSIPIALEVFQDGCEDIFNEMMRIFWSLLCLIRDDNERSNGMTSGAGTENYCGYTSDGDRIDLEALTTLLLELLTIGLTTNSDNFNSFLGGDLNELISIIANQVKLPPRSQELWESDPNEFVQTEDDGFEGSIRYFGGVLLEQICKKGKDRAFQYMFMPQVLAVFERFSGFNSSTAHLTHTAALQTDAILHLESVLWSIGCLGVSYMKNVKSEEKFRRRASQNLNGSLDSKSEEAPKGRESAAIAVISAIPTTEVARVIALFARSLLFDPMQGVPYHAHAVLRGRMLHVLETYILLFDAAYIENVCEACVLCMHPTQPLALRLLASRSLTLILVQVEILTYTTTSILTSLEGPSDAPFSSRGDKMKKDFGIAIVNSTVDLMSTMVQNTLHYGPELIYVTSTVFFRYDSANHNQNSNVALESAAVGAVKVGLKVLGTYSRDHVLLDVSMDMILGLCAVNPVCRAAVFRHCVPQLREWLLQSVASVLTATTNTDTVNQCSAHSSTSASAVPASLVDVCIEILCRLSNSVSDAQDGLPLKSEIVLTCLSILLSTFQCSGLPCRKEGLRGVNVILSYQEGSVKELFTHSTSSSPSFTSAGFAAALSELLLLTLQDCESDPYTHGNCAGSCAGLLCHLLTQFKSVMDLGTMNSLLSTVLHCLGETTSTYVKYSLLMGLIHLFARDAMILAIPSSPFLGTIKPANSPTTIKALAYVLDEWCTLHHHLTSKYSGTISSLGFIELIKIFNMHKDNHEFALKILQLTLSTLPRILLNTEGDDDDGDDEGNDNGNADNSDNSDASEEEDWESDDGQNDGQDDDFDTMMNDSNMASKGSDKSPFAPAEMYLSDMIGSNKTPHTHGDDENEGDFLLVNVSDNLVFSPMKLDPLWGKDLQGSIIELLLSLKSGNGQGQYPSWMNALSAKDQHLVQALVHSR